MNLIKLAEISTKNSLKLNRIQQVNCKYKA